MWKKGNIAAELLWIRSLSRHVMWRTLKNKNAICESAVKSPGEEKKTSAPEANLSRWEIHLLLFRSENELLSSEQVDEMINQTNNLMATTPSVSAET